MSRRWRGAKTALPGRRWDAPPLALAVAPGVWKPIRIVRRTQRPELHRRGHRWDAPPTTGAVAPGVWKPIRIVRRTQRPELHRRGHRWDAPPVTPTVPGIWTVGRVNRRTQRPELHRRGHRWDAPPVTPITPNGWAVSRVYRRTQRPEIHRRGHRWNAPPFTQPLVPEWLPPRIARRRTQPIVYRRGCRWDAPPIALAVAPGVWKPVRITRRTQRPELHRHGRHWDALYQPVLSKLRPTIDVVSIALVRELTTIPDNMVDALLPKDKALWTASGFIQTFGVQESSGKYVPLHGSIAEVHGWANAGTSGKPPWGKASQLLEQVKMECYRSTTFPKTLNLSAFGDYKKARVHTAYFVGESRRVPADDGSFAHYEGELLIHWTPQD